MLEREGVGGEGERCVHVEVRGQLCSVNILFLPLCGFGNVTQVLGLPRPIPLPAKPSLQPRSQSFQGLQLCSKEEKKGSGLIQAPEAPQGQPRSLISIEGSLLYQQDFTQEGTLAPADPPEETPHTSVADLSVGLDVHVTVPSGDTTWPLALLTAQTPQGSPLWKNRLAVWTDG